MKVYGIDLGTTNSCISIFENGSVSVLENEEGSKITPSIVAVKNGEWIVGAPAKRQLEINKNVVTSIKRKMGTNDIVELEGKEYRPEFISAKILDNLVGYANKKLGENIKDIIVTVPAYFNDAQRNATRLAGEIAGLNVKRILNEPTAGSIAYNIKGTSSKILVFDLGGGTFDISILNVFDDEYEVIATDGDNNLGGDDWDDLIIAKLKTYCKNELKLTDVDSIQIEQRLRVAAEQAKKNLSAQSETEINIPFIGINSDGPVNVNYKLTKTEFEKSALELLKRVEDLLSKILEDSKEDVNKIKNVVLIGGSTRMPMIKSVIEKYFNSEKISNQLNVDEAVSVGAAILADSIYNELSKNEVALLDVTSQSFGTTLVGDRFDILIPRNTTIPVSITREYTTTEDYETEIDVDVRQGEEPFGSDNFLIGEFILTNIEKAKAGVPNFITTFKIDSNGILSVECYDEKTKSKNSISIKNALHIDETEIKKLKYDFENGDVK